MLVLGIKKISAELGALAGKPQGERVERITDDQVAQLVRFVFQRIPDAASLQGEARRVAIALQLAATKQIAAVRYHLASPPEQAAETELHATASWNLLVAFAKIWHDHPEFPADAAVETFEFDSDSLFSTAVHRNQPRER